jgi:transposase InsO family protein
MNISAIFQPPAHRTKKGHFFKGPPKQRALGIAEVVIVRLDRRDLVWINVTANPTAEWIARQITEAFPWADAPQHLIRDRDRIYGTIVTRRLRAMGIRDKPTAPASPWQNGFAERLIGSIRRECVDHFVVLGEAHLHRILRAYARYFNDIRTHR